jgi:hypothetical protein
MRHDHGSVPRPGRLGNPSLREDSTVEGLSIPVPASAATASLAAVHRAREAAGASVPGDRGSVASIDLPARDQARMANGNFG